MSDINCPYCKKILIENPDNAPYIWHCSECNRDFNNMLVTKDQTELPLPKLDDYELLKNPELLQVIDAELAKVIVGEELPRKTIFLNACGKFVINAQIASYNLCINDESGAGKDFITKNVLKIFQKDEVQSRSRISPTAFTYWHNTKTEPTWTWDGKICYLADINNSILNHDVFKVMCSDETCSTITIEHKAIDIEIKGKPVMLITIASASPNSEMLRRFPIVNLDTGVDQTKKIKEKQAVIAAEGKKIEYSSLVPIALSKLRRVQVKIPFAKDLVDFFPDSLIMRTHFHRLLDYIKASAALYQHQRDLDDEGFIIATSQDYDNATIPLRATTSNTSMIPLTRKQRMLLEVCEKLSEFSVKELEPHAPFLVQSKIYEAVSKLQELGFLTSEIRELEGKNKPVRFYKYAKFSLGNIPTWSDIIDKKKEITGTQGNTGITGKEGISKEEQSNSHNFLNSLPKLPAESDVITIVKEFDNDRKGTDKQTVIDKCGEDAVRHAIAVGNVFEEPAGFLKVLE